MSDAPRVFQIQLVCAICAELDRQNPGVLIDQAMMNAVIQAADDLVVAAKAGGLTLKTEGP